MHADKPILPQFPLSLIAFPGESLNLHIFEARYKQLINECWENGSTFGIPPFQGGKLMFFGTEMKVLEISKLYPDGKMDIKTEGMRIYQIHQFHKVQSPKLYPAASVSFLENEYFYNPELAQEILVKMRKLFEILKITKSVESFEKGFNSYKIAHHVGLSDDEKLKLITMRSENQRLQNINEHLDKFIPSLQKAEALKARVAMNGHFKNLKSPDF